MSWETLKVNRHYEIYNKYPYPIRRKSDHGVINSGIRVDGYQRVYLDKKEYLKHQVVATQWLPNPSKKDEYEEEELEYNNTDKKKHRKQRAQREDEYEKEIDKKTGKRKPRKLKTIKEGEYEEEEEVDEVINKKKPKKQKTRKEEEYEEENVDSTGKKKPRKRA